MDLANPRYILRNWMAAEAYEAAERGDFGPVREVHKLLCNPYEEQVTRAGLEQTYDAAPIQPTRPESTHPPTQPPTHLHNPRPPICPSTEQAGSVDERWAQPTPQWARERPGVAFMS